MNSAGLLCGQDDDGLRERKVTRNARGQVVSAATRRATRRACVTTALAA